MNRRHKTGKVVKISEKQSAFNPRIPDLGTKGLRSTFPQSQTITVLLMTVDNQNLSIPSGESLLILSVFGQADEALLTAWPLGRSHLAAISSYATSNGLYRVQGNLQKEILNQLSASRFGSLHQRALDLLGERLRSGHDDQEPTWDAVFERLATHLYLHDTVAFRSLCDRVADLPLSSPLAQQRRAFFAAGALMSADQSAAAAAQFDRLLQRPDLVPYIHARTLNARAVLHRIQGQPEAALDGYRQAVELWRALANRHHEAMVLTNMGIVNYELRHYAEALIFFGRAMDIFEEENNAHWVAVVHNEMGLVDRDLGRWTTALDHFDRFITQRDAAGATHHVGLGQLNRGEVFLFQGDIAAATAAFNEAAKRVDSARYQIDILFYLGLASLAKKEHDTAEHHFREALALAQDTHRIEFIPHLYFHLGRLLIETGRPQEGRSDLMHGIKIIEESRRPIENEAVKISLFGRWQQLYEAIVLLELSEGEAAAALRWTERARARAFADNVAAREEGSNPDRWIMTWLNEVGADECLISYFCTGVLESDIPLLRMLAADHPLRSVLLTPPHTVRFLLSKGTLTVKKLPFDPNLLTSSSPRGQQAARLLDPRIRRQLGNILLDQLDFDGIGRLTILPHGPIHAVPFAALLTERGGGPIVSLAPSLHILRALRERPARPFEPANGIIIPFEGRDPDRKLHFVLPEASRISGLTGSPQYLPTYGSLRELSDGVNWLHFACHGWFDFDQPLRSYLEIGPDTDLTAAEILNHWTLNAALVTLSACQTGVSRVLRGDEPMGLVRAFLSAGATAVVVTQWPVDDLAAAVLMAQFYKNLSRRLDPAAALAAAQFKTRTITRRELHEKFSDLMIQQAEAGKMGTQTDEGRPFADPHFWAGFVLVGR